MYYPWESYSFLKYFKHELLTDPGPKLKEWHEMLGDIGERTDSDGYYRKFYVDATKTTDNKEVIYTDLYSDTKTLSTVLTFEPEGQAPSTATLTIIGANFKDFYL